MWWARGNIQENEELCCDLLVLEVMPTVAKTYAGTLISTLDFLSGAKLTLPLTASGISFKDSLKRRLTMIMERSTPRSVPVSGRVMLLVLGTTLILTPVWAQTSAQNVEEKVEKTVEAVGIEKEIERKVEKAVDEGVIDTEIEQAIREDIEKLEADALAQVLVEHRKKSKFTDPADFLFCQADGRPTDPDSLRRLVSTRRWNEQVPRIRSAPVVVHAFRHLVGTIIHQATGSVKLAQTQLGHAKISTTGDIYTHVDERELEKSASAVEQALSKVVVEMLYESDDSTRTVQ